jgi:hypothetical protein
MGSLFNICEQFDKVTYVHIESVSHSKAALDSDVFRIVKQLHEISQNFHYFPNRKHSGIKLTVSGSIMKNTDITKLTEWIKNHLKSLSNY